MKYFSVKGHIIIAHIKGHIIIKISHVVLGFFFCLEFLYTFNIVESCIFSLDIKIEFH